MDPASTVFNVVLVVFLVLLNGFFVAAEFAMVKVRSTRIETLLQEGNTRAKYAKKLVDHLDAYLSACQLGITLASLGLGWIGEPAVAHMIEPVLLDLGFSEAVIQTISFGIAFSLITALHIILGELAPKSLAIQKADSVTIWTSVPLIGFYKLMYPFIWILNTMTGWILRGVGIQVASEHEAAHTEEEIRILMEESQKQGYINKTELTLVDNIFDFAERHAKEVMIPRTDMVCLYAEDPFAVNMEKALDEQLTRYPVCDPDKDNIIGFVHIKDLLAVLAKGESPALRDLVRGVLAVPESMPISDLLKLLQKNRAQIAIVIDEYGGTAGLVTVEDILEEIVGEIQDEFDEERPFVEIREDNIHSVDGRLLLEEVNEVFGLKLDSDDIDTLGGWVSARVEMPPHPGQKISHEEYEFVVEEVDNMRVTRVLLRTDLRKVAVKE
ncbi:hemolysin family protein [Sporomusa acidovorans]|uniref:Magnesium and cobalt efflux protein CorC n=1 Tax=Sporomusa acidovorans (strain ATCC 49682 / DSM 3132 / Mol) TaxID=1123286 RepID=A0ABZ3J0Y9_SPOA4|nr:hemolysin family protein [Sporomusa acidovorans]OZC21408.1 hemolysin C [Sporomusa acidovorans DSM 3132]SDE54984.1 Hemolysin, contains CBS domains [Sporomusa acidovorans]